MVFLARVPFVQIHSGNNSKRVFLCICICYEIENDSETISICYAPLKTAKNNCVCEKLIPKTFLSVSVYPMKCIINSKIFFSVCNAIWTNGIFGPLPRTLGHTPGYSRDFPEEIFRKNPGRSQSFCRNSPREHGWDQ